jgi:hypothetical protein
MLECRSFCARLAQGWGNSISGGFQVAEKPSEAVEPELVKAQTHLAQLHFENWLTFLALLRAKFKKTATDSTSIEDRQSAREGASITSGTAASKTTKVGPQR